MIINLLQSLQKVINIDLRSQYKKKVSTNLNKCNSVSKHFYQRNLKSRIKTRPTHAKVISTGIFFELFGFFLANSAITIVGSVADWDPLAAAIMLCWIEFFNCKFYSSDFNSIYFNLVNNFKIGIIFGIFVDALKLTS
ncbi:hypothetical protein CPARA_3gp389 (nucleomorph) [Cryptomonas paramecium]|uniref:Ycf20 n=1 Tax=Cryptomonas paramaecium TaxID=2898 RepID=F2HIC3_9CRYP|nr:hypothetical protein CPARA_3gp389 [Cryptomonas paramecium]AEA39047.1 hypothetical protein CPARA_3gp389 [Cryptomonas paramecium]|mmetsp:Transcript_52135/g.136260  ORF Transcript_52135/g.136260 Transcript_52135/m.136260 type:complete len:138 (-) Transcript_52135:11684-12097(-)